MAFSDLTDMQKTEMQVTMAALILNDDKAEISAENLQKVTTAADCKISSIWFCSLMYYGQNVDEMLKTGGGSGGSSSGGAEEAAEEAVVEEVVEEEAEESSDASFDLFD